MALFFLSFFSFFLSFFFSFFFFLIANIFNPKNVTMPSGVLEATRALGFSWKVKNNSFAICVFSLCYLLCDSMVTDLLFIYFLLIYLFIYNIRIARYFPTVHYALNLRDASKNEFERNMERRYDFRRRKPKCSEKTCARKYGSRTKFTYDSGPTGNRTQAALLKDTRTTAAPTCCANLPTYVLALLIGICNSLLLVA